MHGQLQALSEYCQEPYTFDIFYPGVSIFTLTALSIDRLLVISHTMKVVREKASRRIVVMVTSVWVLSTIIAIPDAISYHLVSIAPS